MMWRFLSTVKSGAYALRIKGHEVFVVSLASPRQERRVSGIFKRNFLLKGRSPSRIEAKYVALSRRKPGCESRPGHNTLLHFLGNCDRQTSGHPLKEGFP